MKRTEKFRVGIFGGAGITGAELIRWIVFHPKLELAFVHSRSNGGASVASVHPQLRGLCELSFEAGSPVELASTVDSVFLALRHGEAAALATELKSYDGIVVDLTGDHRLADPSLYPTVYGFEHPAPNLLKIFVYGIPELFRGKIKGAKRISNPGCFATGAILAAAPLVAEGKVKGSLFFSSVTGSSGAGAALSATTHHPFRDENLFAYKVFCHPHEAEISASLTAHPVTLVAHSGPFVRGIHTTLRVEMGTPQKGEELLALYKDFYRESPFIRVLDEPPHVKRVAGSNFVDLYPVARGNEVVVLSVLDNLVKGAAGQAIQNLNLAIGENEKEGLWTAPLYP